MKLEDKRLKLTKHRLEVLHRLNINNTDELLTYYPIRYDMITDKPFHEWQEKDKVTFEARVISKVSSWRKGRLVTSNFEVETEETVLKITIFNRPWADSLKFDQRMTITGIYKGKNKVTAMTYDLKSMDEHPAVTPIYSIKEGIRQNTVRDCIAKVYEILQNEIIDLVPEEYIRKYRLLRKAEAIRRIHFPNDKKEIESAYRTLKYEEFLRFFVAMRMMKNSEGTGIYKQPKRFDMKILKECINTLPYSLTKDQVSSLNDILRDMASTRMMYRLVQGDVGCGKTAVASLALYACALSKMQGALLAPTEILARQHLSSLKNTIRDDGVVIECLYSGLSAAEKRDILERLKDGKIDILVGTHSILQESVEFKNLGLVVADEQQRFGVNQRKALKEKGDYADFLVMSATPIPRTLAATLYGDMDVSTIETMPAGRKDPVTTYIEENSFRSVLDDVFKLLNNGRQLYVICAAVEENEAYDARDVYQTAENLQKLFKNHKVGVLHGKMSSEEKQEIMNLFYKNEIQVLVSTTVVEVGMNVVNATGMIIYDADRFGLSQLHQLRGRVQRGSERGYCWLLSGSHEDKVKERLNVLVKTNNGFEIAYEDLRLRGPGDILGTRQSGVPDFILGNLIQDTDIIDTARKDAEHIVLNMDTPSYSAIIDYVNRKNQEKNFDNI